MDNILEFFKESFEESRAGFLNQAKTLKGELLSHEISPGHAFDSLYLPPASGKHERLLILTSGIHGIEGLAGSALQRYFLAKIYPELKKEDNGYLIIHGINPYGMKHFRRVTERNVDLNRNFDVSPELFQNKNPGYAKLIKFLNPGRPLSRSFFSLSSVYYILRYGMDNLRRAILRGQYEFPPSIFYGGKDFEPQVGLIQNLVTGIGEKYKKVLLIDLHTGYGERGKLHLFGDRSPFLDETHMHEVFKGLKVDYGQEKDFYTVSGGFTVFMAKLFYQKASFAGIVFEFGTIDSHKVSGSLESLYLMVNEPYERKKFKEMFYPSSKEWRTGIVHQFEATMSTVLNNWNSAN